jgi:hypothetical protein
MKTATVNWRQVGHWVACAPVWGHRSGSNVVISATSPKPVTQASLAGGDLFAATASLLGDTAVKAAPMAGA